MKQRKTLSNTRARNIKAAAETATAIAARIEGGRLNRVDKRRLTVDTPLLPRPPLLPSEQHPFEYMTIGGDWLGCSAKDAEVLMAGEFHVRARAPQTPAQNDEGPRVQVQRDRLVDTTSEARKTYPMARGLLDYFPDALAEVSNVSFKGNEKHNPGEEMHHARGKSMDHADCIMRHLVRRGGFDGDIRESAALAWRALALLQEELEREYAFPLPRAAKL